MAVGDGIRGVGASQKYLDINTPLEEWVEIAMPGVSINGVDYTANVITEPERFHILSERTCLKADETVLTEFVAGDLGVGIGDTVAVSGGAGSMPYRVSGIYQCANDMGANVGLSREGYAKIGRETAGMWCVHYFLEDVSMQQEVMLALEGLPCHWISTRSFTAFLLPAVWDCFRGWLRPRFALGYLVY